MSLMQNVLKLRVQQDSGLLVEDFSAAVASLGTVRMQVAACACAGRADLYPHII